MKIIILGAGQVGTTLAANLVSEDNDITLVDNESQHLQNLQDKHDLRVVKGSPSSPPMITPTAISTTLPRTANSRNSLRKLIKFPFVLV
jgi:Trk K+ transport system NAD-binding subunit